MKPKKILITGANGFIGKQISEKLIQSQNELIRIDLVGNKDVLEVDVSNSEALNKFLNSAKPDVIVHTAAVKDLVSCEDDRLKAWDTNVESTRTLVNYSHVNKCKIVFISSDVIFDGEKGDYSENDFPNPINWYGTTKLHSEFLIKQTDDYAICRTALVIGDLNQAYTEILKGELETPVLRNQTLLPHYIYNRLKKALTVRLPDNIISSPTHVELLAESIDRIIQNDLKGVFHTTGSEIISRYDFALKLANFHNLNSSLIEVDNSQVFKLRPKNIGMNVKNTFQNLGILEKEWDIESVFKKIKWTEIK